MFDIYKKNFEIVDSTGKKQVYELLPLGGNMLPKLYKLLKKTTPILDLSEQKELDGDTIDTKELLNLLDEETISLLHELALATLIKSYPKEDKAKLEGFVTQNLFSLFNPIIALNTQS